MILKLNLLAIAIFLLSFSTNCIAQPQVHPLETHSYMSVSELNNLLEVIKSTPILNELDNWYTKECKTLETYRNALLNLSEDISEYQKFLELSAKVSRNNWEIYLKQNIDNEELKGEMQYRLAWKDFLARLSSLMVDLIDLQNLAKTGKLKL